MLKDFKILPTRGSLYKITIIDSDFTEVFEEQYIMSGGISTVCFVAVAEIYSKRNLNVAKNLYLLMYLIHNKYYVNINYQLNNYKLNAGTYYNEYISDIKKFLLFT